jgi:hypothetical protein
LKDVVNLKQKKYRDSLETELYFVCGNELITQGEINSLIGRKANGLESNIHLSAYNNFLEEISMYARLKIAE